MATKTLLGNDNNNDNNNNISDEITSVHFNQPSSMAAAAAVPVIDFSLMPENIRRDTIRYLRPNPGESFSQSFPESARMLAQRYPHAVIPDDGVVVAQSPQTPGGAENS